MNTTPELDALIALAREVAKNAAGQLFRLPVRHVMNTFKLPDLVTASALLRTLEHRGVLRAFRRGTATKDGIRGTPTLYTFHEPQS
jgi:hypothetical protein